MKPKAYIYLILFIFTLGSFAQVDRSKQPQPGPAPIIELKNPEKSKLDNGITIMVVEDHVLPRVSYSLRIDNNPIVEGTKTGVASILGAMLGNGTTTIAKEKFNEEIDFMGANLNFGSQGAFANGLSKYAERLFEMMADAAKNPLLTQEEFEKEKQKLLESLETQEKSVATISNRVSNALSYGRNHPYGEFATKESINNITFNDVKEYYNKYFQPGNVYLVAIGDIDDDKVEKMAKKYFGDWEKTSTVEIPIIEPNKNVTSTQIDFVDVPNAVQTNITIVNNVKLKMSDDDYHAALITNYILGGGAFGYLYKNLREDKGYTYGAYSNINDSRYGAGQFSATAEVRNEVTDSSIVEAMKEINRIRTVLVDEETLSIAKAKYTGNFVLALEKPQTIANYALNIELNDLDNDFYKDYLKNINEVSAEDVRRVANKYFKSENARIVVVGKGSDVLENLEKTGYPIVYYDKYANKVDKPIFSKPIPDGVTAQSVFDKYIEAVGGKEKLKSVKTVFSTADVSITNVPMKLTAEMKSMAPNKESMEMSAEGMGVLMKQKFDGGKGYAEQQGQKRELTDAEIAEKKNESSIFPELYFTEDNSSLESLTAIEGKDVYKVKITKGDKTSYRYYDVNNGLLLRSESTVEAMGQTVNSIIDYSDYKDVDGVMMPMSQKVESGPQKIDLTITSLEINENVTDADFK